MFNVRHQQCPRCNGHVSAEHVATEEFPHHIVTYLLCEFCGVGVETEWNRVGDACEEAFSLTYHEKTEPRNFGMFEQRLRDARVA